MFRSILVYGAISGTIIILGIIVSLAVPGIPHSQVVGYLIMVIALSAIFVGLKRYRDIQLGGVIKFLPAFGMGLGIAAVAGVAYVIVWEIYLSVTDYVFMEQYVQAAIEARQAAGMSGAELQAYITEMNAMRENYANPLYRLPMTFLEIFPVGLIIALISAGLLRNPRLLPYRPTV